MKLVKLEHSQIQISNIYSNATSISLTDKVQMWRDNNLHDSEIDLISFIFLAINSSTGFSDGLRFTYFLDNALKIDKLYENLTIRNLLMLYEKCEALMNNNLVIGVYFFKPRDLAYDIYEQTSNISGYNEIRNIFIDHVEQYPTAYIFYKVLASGENHFFSKTIERFADFLVQQCKIAGSYSIPLYGYEFSELDKVLPLEYILSDIPDIYILEDPNNKGYTHSLILST